MAFGSLLALLDDIAVILDDVSLMTKVAAKKTAGVLGDDLAVNAEKVLGVRPDRELPVVWAVAKGSFLNKCILVPAALLIAAWMPGLITPMLVCGGLYLCFEGAEKLLHTRATHSDKEREEVAHKLAKGSEDLVSLERDKIRGAVRTDFILSAEIIVLTLGVVEGQDLLTQVIVLSSISTLMTVGVYGLVAGIVKIDDLGVLLMNREPLSDGAKLAIKVGGALLWFAPQLMKLLSVIGTVAMFLVGGGILMHASHTASALIEQSAAWLGLGQTLVPLLVSGLIGLGSGLVLVWLVKKVLALKAQGPEL